SKATTRQPPMPATRTGPVEGELPLYRNLIDGQWVAPSGDTSFESFDPFTGAPWARIARSTPEDVERAVQAASRAFEGRAWRGISASERGHILHRLGDLIAEQAERLAQIETRDNGKLIAEMRTQLRNIPSWFRYFAGLADKLEGRVIPI